jgi:hypothetical protein
MYDTSGLHSVCYAEPRDYNIAGRLDWLRGELARQEGARKAPTVADEGRALRAVALGNSVPAAEAYAWFGTFLGLFPPCAIFARILGGFYVREVPYTNGFFLWCLLLLSMNAVCCYVGRRMGRAVGRKLGDPRAFSAPLLLLFSLMMAVAWGVVTGAAGGAVGFVVGAVFGVMCALPVALAAFPVFALLHRALARDGMIEERRLWPLAWGVPLTVTALILSPWIR